MEEGIIDLKDWCVMKRNWVLKVVLAITVLLLPTLASSQEPYKFERMWPTLKQPGKFRAPFDVAVDSNGFVYATDEGNDRIQKFTADGQFVTKWGGFYSPGGIAVDSSDFVYIADTMNHRILKFTADGEFVTKWGSYGWGDGQFCRPWGIAVDSNGFVYVVDWGGTAAFRSSPLTGSLLINGGVKVREMVSLVFLTT
jgi:sugar lactone lactonase YvrE